MSEFATAQLAFLQSDCCLGRVAIGVDDLGSIDPWRPRVIEVRGRPEVVDDRARWTEATDRVVSWGLDTNDATE